MNKSGNNVDKWFSLFSHFISKVKYLKILITIKYIIIEIKIIRKQNPLNFWLKVAHGSFGTLFKFFVKTFKKKIQNTI